MKGRKDDLVNKDIKMLQYDPNVDIVKERTTKGLLSFDKMAIRRELFNKSSNSNNISIENINTYYKTLKKVKSIPNFRKYPMIIEEIPHHLQVSYY